jgi:hypothetical protein
LQDGTIKERIIPNTGHAVRDGDAGQTSARTKRINLNTRYAVGDDYAG